MSDLKKRTITAIVLLLILIPAIYFGGIVFVVLGGILTVLSSYELEHMYKMTNKWSFNQFINIIFGLFVYLSLYISYITYRYIYVVFIIIAVFIVEGSIAVFKKESDINDIGRSLITVFYPSIGMGSLAIIRNFDTCLFRNGLFLIIYLACIVSFTDMFAYFFGCKYGKRKLAPHISPNKSLEGSIAGTVFGVLISTCFAFFSGVSKYLFFFSTNTFIVILLTVLLSLVVSIVDQIGDLLESRLKRSYGLKDFSHILPGHGGILDRFDSYIFTAPLLLVYLLLL